MNDAIVMGGSIAGMCTAASLSRTFKRVILIEKDQDPDAPTARVSVPHANQVHLMLSHGCDIIESLFPGIFEQMKADGADPRDIGRDIKWYQHGAWKTPVETGLTSWFQTRALLEYHMRKCLARIPNVTQYHGKPIEHPIHEGGKVVGVKYRDGEIQLADFIVDATGRNSRTPRWLQEWGYEKPPEETVEIGLSYVGGLFEARPDKVGKGLAVFYHAPNIKRGGVILPVEGNRWLVSLIGYHGESAPTDPTQYVEWSAKLAQPDVHDALASTKPVEKIRHFSIPRQVRRRYDKLRAWPENYVVVGDAACCFDPTFAQGMTIAAMGADLVGALAGRVPASTIRKKLIDITTLPWAMTSIEAHRWPETKGSRLPGASLFHRFSSRLYSLSSTNPELYKIMLHILQFEASPAALLKPRILRMVLFGKAPRH